MGAKEERKWLNVRSWDTFDLSQGASLGKRQDFREMPLVSCVSKIRESVQSEETR